MTSLTLKTRDDYIKDNNASDRIYNYKCSRDKLDGQVRLNSSAANDSSSSGNAHLARSGSIASDCHVGFSTLPNQVFRKAVKRGFEFSLMVVGESGLGKSTLINSLFMADIYNMEHLGPSRRLKKTVYVEQCTMLIKEKGVHVKMTIVDTPGFGDAVDNSNCWTPVVDYIDSRFEEYLSLESKVTRGVNFSDTRIHCLLYFIAPTGHGLKPLDIEFIRRIHDKVNVIPVIAKADTMTMDEIRDFKKTIINEITQHKLRIYEFPDICGEEEEDSKWGRLKDRVPFSVVGANTLIDKGGHKVRGRAYPWGLVEVDNLEHNDFVALRNLLIRYHLQDLRDVTHSVLYENYRFAKLSGIAQESKFRTVDGKDPMAQMEFEKREHESKLRKMEAEMEQVFEMKVKEKKMKLKESEADLQRRAEQMTRQLFEEDQELKQKRTALDQELANTTAALEKNSLSGSDGALSNELHPKEKNQSSKRKGLFK